MSKSNDDTGLVPAGSLSEIAGAVVNAVPQVPDEVEEHVEGVVWHALAIVDELADPAIDTSE